MESSRANYKMSLLFRVVYLLVLLWIQFAGVMVISSSSPDYSKLIYKGCADQKFPDDSDIWAENLRSLFDSLSTESRKSNFSQTITGRQQQGGGGGGGGSLQIFGLYQCRGDLSGTECYDCVSRFPKLSRKLCGEAAIASRIQLEGCYMRYEVVGFKQVSSTELLYKYCSTKSFSSSSSNDDDDDNGNGIVNGSRSNSTGGGDMFEERRDTAFEETENGVAGNGGFYTGVYGGVVVLGQCEGDLDGGDCEDCVRTALERVKAECGEAMSGQVYLNRCYISYAYYSNGIEQAESADDISSSSSSSSSGERQRKQKTAAIAVGVVAGAGFLLVLLLFTKSVLKKKQLASKRATPAPYTEYVYT